MNLIVLPGTYSIYQFNVHSKLPSWIYTSDFYSVTKTKDELSVVALQKDYYLKGITADTDWRVLKIKGPLDLSLVGIIANISAILKEKNIPIFVISTFDTDYIMIKQRKVNAGITALKETGYNISIEKS
jgi:hypothetical protein